MSSGICFVDLRDCRAIRTFASYTRSSSMNRFKPQQTVRINDTQSEYHKCLAKVVKVGARSYDVAVGKLTMRVVPEQLLGVRKP